MLNQIMLSYKKSDFPQNNKTSLKDTCQKNCKCFSFRAEKYWYKLWKKWYSINLSFKCCINTTVGLILKPGGETSSLRALKFFLKYQIRSQKSVVLIQLPATEILEISVPIDVDSEVLFHIETAEIRNANKTILVKIFHVLKRIAMWIYRTSLSKSFS